MDCEAVKDSQQYAITYQTSPETYIVVEYSPDDSTDMFQIGRSSDNCIDFKILNTFIPKSKRSRMECGACKKSSVSRFAFRLVIDRNYPHEARIYAAAFNSNRNICVGEKFITCKEEGQVDGGTLNGVYISHLNGPFEGGMAVQKGWWEVSVRGQLYDIRLPRTNQPVTTIMTEESNVLRDGSLIEIAGSTLLWRTAEGLKHAPNIQDLRLLVKELSPELSLKHLQCRDEDYEECDRVIIPSYCPNKFEFKRPCVHVKCGHVEIREPAKVIRKPCVACGKVSLLIPIYMGMEGDFYVDSAPPDHVFIPCGHLATEKTVKYWLKRHIPSYKEDFGARCPFCMRAILCYPGFVKAIF